MMAAMRILVLGGTWFLGRTVVEAAQARGWHVTTFTRTSEVPGAEALHGDRTDPAAIARLADAGPWDGVIDTSGQVPRVVRDSARALVDVAERYVYISTVSVYEDWPHQPVDEGSPVREGSMDLDGPGEPDDPVEYGQFKRGCEHAALHAFGTDRALILRPTAILGPYEIVGRLPWWLARMTRGGRVLSPGMPNRAIQPIDARDLAAFILDGVEHGVSGTYNAAAPIGHATMGTFLASCADATMGVRGGQLEQVWVDGPWLAAHGVRQWTELPLWREPAGTWAVDAARAHQQGLRCRPIWQTVHETWEWLAAGAQFNHHRTSHHGIAPEREAEILAAWFAVPLLDRAANHLG